MGLGQILASIGDWFYEAAPIIGGLGGFVGGVAAVVAIIFLWLNLKAIRKQIELQYKGLLFIHLTGVESGKNQLIVNYRFGESRQVPLLLRGMKWGASMKKEIEFDSEYDKFKKEVKKDIKGPIVADQECFVNAPMLPEVQRFFELDPQKNIGSSEEFFLHALFGYVDLTGKEYWLYSCWSVRLVIEVPSEGELAVANYFRDEEYRFLN